MSISKQLFGVDFTDTIPPESISYGGNGETMNKLHINKKVIVTFGIVAVTIAIGWGVYHFNKKKEQ